MCLCAELDVCAWSVFLLSRACTWSSKVLICRHCALLLSVVSCSGTVTLADFNDAPKSIMTWDAATEGTQVRTAAHPGLQGLAC